MHSRPTDFLEKKGETVLMYILLIDIITALPYFLTRRKAYDGNWREEWTNVRYTSWTEWYIQNSVSQLTMQSVFFLLKQTLHIFLLDYIGKFRSCLLCWLYYIYWCRYGLVWTERTTRRRLITWQVKLFHEEKLLKEIRRITNEI